MSLIKFKNKRLPLFNENFNSIFDFDDLFSDDFFLKRRTVPAANIKEEDTSFSIEVAVPGFSKEEIEVAIEEGYLKISAQKNDETEEKEEDYTRKEFSFKSFERSFKLPANIDENEDVKATYENGILNLCLVKKEIITSTDKKVIAID